MNENSVYLEEKPVKLDLKDRKILFELDFKARMPFSQLAKKVGLSKQGTEYRVASLMRKGVIKRFYPVINVPKLGYLYCRLLLTLQNATKERRAEIVEYPTHHNKVFWLFQMQGPYDLLVVMWAKTVSEFREFIEELESAFGENVKRKQETIATDVVHFQHRYLLDTSKTEEIHIKETSERIKIDKLDERILGNLRNDARMPLAEIARKVDVSAKVVAYRLKKLEKNRLIEGYRPIIDHNRIGYTYYKVFIHLNKVSKEELARLKAHIKNSPLVIYTVEGVGMPGDIDIEMMVQSNKQLFDFIEELKYAFPALIGEYETAMFIDTLKVKYLPF